MDDTSPTATRIHSVSVVIPVLQGEHTLRPLVDEILEFASETRTPGGNDFRVTEIVLVYDNGSDNSDIVMRELEQEHEPVRTIWLSRNFGQHAATLAGIASSVGDWVVTIDDDGHHDPRDIGVLLDAAVSNRAQVVYAKPTTGSSSGRLKNSASKSAKQLMNGFVPNASDYSRFRLILGSVARGVAAYTGSGVYLDVALGWVAGSFATAPTVLRGETRSSGGGLRGVLELAGRLVVTSGTRGLRVVSAIGIVFAVLGAALAIWAIVVHFTNTALAIGWAPSVIIVLIASGAILFSLGVIAEYLGVIVRVTLGKPPYLITSDPAAGPLGAPRNRR
jgi:polyisoprenyl-phosphate glycosyltransferase